MRCAVALLFFVVASFAHSQTVDDVEQVLRNTVPAAEVGGVVLNRVDRIHSSMGSPVGGFQEASAVNDVPLIDDLVETVDARRRQCRVLDSHIALHFVAEEPARFLKQEQQLLLQCPKGMRFRLGVVQNGVGVNAARLYWRDADDRRRPAQLAFALPSGQPLARTVFESDGQPFQVAFVAVLHAAGEEPMVGELEMPGSLAIRVVPE